jgi:hypothetical protein
MTTLNILLLIIVLLYSHFLADFWFQTDMMAINKSTSIKWLSYHVLTYWLITICFVFVSPWYWIFNALSHWIIDFFTSKCTSYYWKKEMRHEFFCMIGFDQFLHTAILIITLLPFIG